MMTVLLSPDFSPAGFTADSRARKRGWEGLTVYEMWTSLRSWKILHMERTGISLAREGKRSTLTILENAPSGVAMVGRSGAIACWLLTLFQRYTLGSVICLCREVACSKWGAALNEQVDVCFLESNYLLDDFNPFTLGQFQRGKLHPVMKHLA